MKKTLFTALLASMLMAVASPLSAQEENGFKKINVREDFAENGFQWFHDAELLAAGDKTKSNAMTIGWGGIGTLWGRTALTVYVAEKRYTKEFMDKAEYFTVMAFDVEHSNVLRYMGTKSGRDGDKAQALGLHTAYTANGTPYYTEASLVIECKIMYAAPFDPDHFKSEVPKRMYSHFPSIRQAPSHSGGEACRMLTYLGSIVKVIIPLNSQLKNLSLRPSLNCYQYPTGSSVSITICRPAG